MNSLQDDAQERQRLIDRLTRLQEIEQEKKGLQDKAIDYMLTWAEGSQDELIG